ncbi:MAG: SPOR domain-containing protein, partial [Pseudomonadota bacterium]|nr:SPOR domain-containing protein [Pseudomonadota bacterium]
KVVSTGKAAPTGKVVSTGQAASTGKVLAAGKTSPAGKTISTGKVVSAGQAVSTGQDVYRIQVVAFPDRLRAAAVADRLKKSYPQVSMEQASMDGKGVWNRVMVGEFSSLEEGRRFLQAEGLERLYPGSFVRKTKGK